MKNDDDDDNTAAKKCIICGCKGHALFGCFTHWTGHKKTNGKCMKQ